jgi:GNAT superfamily N-acetyltransferase
MHRHEEGFELDPDQDRLDLDLVERWLSVESYWAFGRPRGQIERSVANSTVYGLYNDLGFQVGLFRVVTDKATFAWLCDVFIDPRYRGRGLAQWAIAQIRDDLYDLGVYRIILVTQDAHGVYAKVGFTALSEPQKMMILTAPVVRQEP